MRLCLIRHGETAWNAEQRMQGHKDLPLSQEGLEQADALAAGFSTATIHAIYSSDLIRAQQTARPLAKRLGLPLQFCPLLRERHYGRCEGMIRREIAAHFPEDAKALRERDPHYILPEGGESLHMHWVRVMDCISSLATTHENDTIVVVTHGGVLDLVYRRAKGLALEAPRDFEIPNTGINWLSILKEEWHIETWGQISHLGERGAIEVRLDF